MSKFIFLPWHIGIIPISVVFAKTATEQIDALYEVADDPATPKDRATELARMAGRMCQRMRVDKSLR